MSAFFYRGWQVTNQFRPYSHDASIELSKLKVLLFLEALIVNITISSFFMLASCDSDPQMQELHVVPFCTALS